MKKWLNKENKTVKNETDDTNQKSNQKETTEKPPKSSGTPKRGIEKLQKIFKNIY